ncbi:PQ-loop repeat-containing protein 1 [Cytospora mali]|uniref:PQ-loop repeat-containing protein 1 n=1 Tax=Cytospora mali TaxID=578113 RepID=A0A194W4M0_CYTMA|nr:PQ-loop repeat-containing protein 1 [Valsa mali]
MRWLTSLAGYIAPIFLILSPILSYGDQAMSMHRNKSSAGFSLDIPLIMLVASFFRIFYYPGARFDTALLIQAFLHVIMQLLLLKIALDHRPAPSAKGGDAALPFAGAKEGLWEKQRPYKFWQWRSPKPYWQTLLWLFIVLTALELVLAPFHGLYATYSVMLGYIGLSVEATLPLPQIFSNARSRSCKGFRVSVLASWLAGDAMKMFWFFTSTTEIPWAFKMCGIFQAFCDAFLGIQYMMYGNGEGKLKDDEGAPVWDGQMTTLAVPNGGSQGGRRTPFEKPL